LSGVRASTVITAAAWRRASRTPAPRGSAAGGSRRRHPRRCRRRSPR
jgi:hypothetical protein